MTGLVFDDGSLVGVDQDAWLSDLFGTYVAEKQAWYRTILTALDAGQSLDEAYAPLRAFGVAAGSGAIRPLTFRGCCAEFASNRS
jgi:hypothetical protein